MTAMLLTAVVGALFGVLAAAGLVGGLSRLRDDPLHHRKRAGKNLAWGLRWIRAWVILKGQGGTAAPSDN